MEFCKVTLTLSLRTNSYNVTIQMKALCLYLHMMIFVFRNATNEISKFGRNLLLAKFGSERVNTMPAKIKYTSGESTFDRISTGGRHRTEWIPLMPTQILTATRIFLLSHKMIWVLINGNLSTIERYEAVVYFSMSFVIDYN